MSREVIEGDRRSVRQFIGSFKRRYGTGIARNRDIE